MLGHKSGVYRRFPRDTETSLVFPTTEGRKKPSKW